MIEQFHTSFKLARGFALAADGHAEVGLLLEMPAVVALAVARKIFRT